MKRLKLSIIAIAIVLFPALSHAFQAGFARISMIDGDALIKTEDSTDWLPASPNTPLYEGDSIWSPDGSRVEIQLQNNTFVRLDERSSVSILALDKDFQQFNLGTGRLYVRTGSIQDNGLQIDVNDTSVMVYDRARFGVAITDGGDEEVSLIKGNAYVEGVGGRTRLRTGEMLTVEGSNSELAPLNPPDEWERWNRERDRRLNARPGGSGHIPEELAAYANDLDANGEWVRVPEYGYVWRPTVMATGEWSPYREGRWVGRGEEYVWVSSESWGWAPYHYGRWVVVPGRG
ncbi:MAG TPA: FecR family protein, partial [Geobacteraceae bacterium]